MYRQNPNSVILKSLQHTSDDTQCVQKYTTLLQISHVVNALFFSVLHSSVHLFLILKVS